MVANSLRAGCSALALPVSDTICEVISALDCCLKLMDRQKYRPKMCDISYERGSVTWFWLKITSCGNPFLGPCGLSGYRVAEKTGVVGRLLK